MTDNLLKEVDSALRWQRVVQLWQRCAKGVILALLLLLAALAALAFYQQQQRETHKRQSDELLRISSQLLQQRTENNNLTKVDLSEFSGAHAQLAALLATVANPQQASAALQQTHTATNADALLSEYACLLQHSSQADIPACSLGPDFAAIETEFLIARLIAAGKTDAALLQLNQAQENTGPLQSERYSRLKAYLTSSLDASLPMPEAQPLQQKHDNTSESTSQ